MKRTSYDKPIGYPLATAGGYGHLNGEDRKEEKRKVPRSRMRRWEAYEIKKIHALRQEGKTWSQVAREVGSTDKGAQCAYLYWVEHKGVERSDKWLEWGQDKVMGIARMRAQGLTDREIAQEYGCSLQNIAYQRKRHGIDKFGNVNYD